MAIEIPGFPGADELRLVDDADEAEPVGRASFNAMADPRLDTQPERRRGHRRQTVDRRAEVRFEPDKPARRSGLDRRLGGWTSCSTV